MSDLANRRDPALLLMEAIERQMAKRADPASRWTSAYEVGITIVGYRTRVRLVGGPDGARRAVGVCRIEVLAPISETETETRIHWHGIKSDDPMEDLRPGLLCERVADEAIAELVWCYSTIPDGGT